MEGSIVLPAAVVAILPPIALGAVFPNMAAVTLLDTHPIGESRGSLCISNSERGRELENLYRLIGVTRYSNVAALLRFVIWFRL
jgi:hypothetical protein